jgi:hypothetical protein
MTPEEFLKDFFAHAQPYDAAKRREYYLRTRKLKGRGGGGRTEAPRNTGVVGPNTAKQRRDAAKVEAEKLRQRLDRLKEVLAQLVDAAKARSGVEPEEEKPDKDKEKTEDRKLTRKEKKEAAERAKESREKNAKDSPSKEVEQLREQIDDVRIKIKVAMERAQKQAQRRAQRRRSTSDNPLERPRQTAG